MPIYAYKCSSCGMSKDILRKISDPALTLCPECGQEALEKQVTAAGFQLKGSGWYVTDFRESGKAAAAPVSGDKSSDGAASSDASAKSADTAATVPAASSTTSTTSSTASATPVASSSATSTSGAST